MEFENVESERREILATGAREQLVESVDQNASSGIVINPRSYLTGDLAFLAVVLGKEGFEGWWCNFCKGYRTNWKTKGALFEPWSMTELIDQAVKNTLQQLKGSDRMGVKEKTNLTDGTIVIYPGLHGLLGIGNQLVNYFFDMLDKEIEPVPPDELLLRESQVARSVHLIQLCNVQQVDALSCLVSRGRPWVSA